MQGMPCQLAAKSGWRHLLDRLYGSRVAIDLMIVVVQDSDASPGLYGQRPSLTSITPLIHASGVSGHGGPFPYAYTIIRPHGHKVDVLAEGRDAAPAPVDQPEVTQGSWVRVGGVVIERGFAEALGVHVGDRVTLGGWSFPVVGIAITAAIPAYTVSFCNDECGISIAMQNSQSEEVPVVGLVWVTRPDAKSLAASASPRDTWDTSST